MYHILVKKDHQEPYEVIKRFNDFYKLRKSIGKYEGEFPRRTLWRDLSPEFVEKRRFELQEFLQTLVKDPETWNELV